MDSDQSNKTSTFSASPNMVAGGNSKSSDAPSQAAPNLPFGVQSLPASIQLPVIGVDAATAALLADALDDFDDTPHSQCTSTQRGRSADNQQVSSNSQLASTVSTTTIASTDAATHSINASSSHQCHSANAVRGPGDSPATAADRQRNNHHHTAYHHPLVYNTLEVARRAYVPAGATERYINATSKQIHLPRAVRDSDIASSCIANIGRQHEDLNVPFRQSLASNALNKDSSLETMAHSHGAVERLNYVLASGENTLAGPLNTTKQPTVVIAPDGSVTFIRKVYDDNSLGSSIVDSFTNDSAHTGTLDGGTLHTVRCAYSNAYTIGSSTPASPRMLFECRTDSIDSPLLAFESAAKALVHLAQRGYDGSQHEAGGAFDFMSQPIESTDDSSGGAETTSSAKSVKFADTSSSPSPFQRYDRWAYKIKLRSDLTFNELNPRWSLKGG